MMQRVTVFKATFGENTIDYYDTLLKYTSRILTVFFNSSSMPNSTALVLTRPKPLKEEKFILVANQLIDFYLRILEKANSSLIENVIGEQLVQLSTLLGFYGEDTLSNQNPLNENQSIGSDLLSSIGLNILAKKSHYSVNFRFYCKCMAICILKQVVLTRNESSESPTSANAVLFPNLNQAQTSSPRSLCKNWIHKIRMSEKDQLHSDNDLLEKDSTSGTANISSSLPNPSFLSPSKMNSSHASSLANAFNQKFKHAAYQFHLIFQNKTYSSNSALVDLANFVCKNWQSSSDAQKFCLPQVKILSGYLSSHLFREKYYLF